MNDEFGLDELDELEQKDKGVNAKVTMKRTPKKAAPKRKTSPKKSTPVVDDFAGKDADDTSGKIRIMIDEVAGMSNYEVIGVNGKVWQVKRGEPVWLPPEAVHVLENAVMTDIVVVRNEITGKREEVVKKYAAIPWRRV